MKNMIRVMVLASAAALSTGIAHADEEWGWGRGMMGRWFMGEMMGDRSGGGFGPGMMMHNRFSSHWIESIKSELEINADQQKLWDAYVTEAKNAQDTMWTMRRDMMAKDSPEKLPDRLIWHETMMAARAESTKSVNAALLALYNALNKEQQEKADGIFTGMGMM
jgi:hypothetical protein